MKIKYIVEDDYYIALAPDGTEIGRGSKKDKRYTEILAHGVEGEYRIKQPDVKVGLIAAGDLPPSTPSNLPPEWTATPNPSWASGVGGTYDLTDDSFDAEGDSLTYSLNGSSAALPTGVTLASNGTLTATTAVTAGTTSGILVDVDDGVNAAVTSSSFSITVSDLAWLGDGLSGEMGCLAANDSWAATTYEYVPKNAPTVTPPTPTTGAALPTSNGVNPNAADEYLMFTWDSSIINNATYNKIFFAKGLNASGQSATNITVGGTEGTPRWFVYYDDDTPSNVNNIKPWNLAEGDKVKLPRMTMVNANWCKVVGIDFTSNGFGRQNNSDDCLYWRCTASNFTIHCTGPTSVQSDRLTVFECYAHTSKDASGNDVAFVAATVGSNDCKIISCEAHDLAGDMIGLDASAPVSGWIIEDNDYYRTLFADGSGNESSDSSLNYSRGEGFFDCKLVGADTSSNKMTVHGNRVWAMRQVDPVLHPGTGTGAPFAVSITSTQKWKLDFRYNVCDDIRSQGITLINGSHLGGGYHSIIGNLFNNVRSTRALWLGTDYTELYLNTVANTTGATVMVDFVRQTSPNTVLSFDCIGNAFIDGPTNGWASESQLDSNSEVHYNAFIGTNTEAYEKGSTGTNYTETDRTALNFGDFIYRRKKLTSDTATGTISNVVPTTSTPSAFLTGSPDSGSADSIGSRSGIGVDDAVYSTW